MVQQPRPQPLGAPPQRQRVLLQRRAASGAAALVVLLIAARRRQLGLRAALAAAIAASAAAVLVSRLDSGLQRRRADRAAKLESAAKVAASLPEVESEDGTVPPEFVRAQKFAAKGLPGISNDDKLKLYALFKQATHGPCDTAKPSMLDFVASAKWTAWKALGDLERGAAEQQYTAFVGSLAPGWDTVSAAELAQRAAAATEPDSRSVSMAPRVSTMVEHDDIPVDQQDDMQRLFTLAGSCDADGLAAALKAVQDVNAIRSGDQETLLHMACDRGDLASVNLLLQAGADVEAKDTQGLTPLAYALMNDHEAIAGILVAQAHADLFGKCNEGEPFLDLCSKTLRERLVKLARA